MNRWPSPMERFWARFEKAPSGCWLWKAQINRDGYAVFSLYGKKVRAHRASYELLVAPIPEGLQLDHLCRVRHCVNPSHLEPVTQTENMRRGENFVARNAAKTRCDRGHDFTPANTYWRPGGFRDCRQCVRDRARRYQQRKRAAA